MILCWKYCFFCNFFDKNVFSVIWQISCLFCDFDKICSFSISLINFAFFLLFSRFFAGSVFFMIFWQNQSSSSDSLTNFSFFLQSSIFITILTTLVFLPCSYVDISTFYTIICIYFRSPLHSFRDSLFKLVFFLWCFDERCTSFMILLKFFTIFWWSSRYFPMIGCWN